MTSKEVGRTGRIVKALIFLAVFVFCAWWIWIGVATFFWSQGSNENAKFEAIMFFRGERGIAPAIHRPEWTPDGSSIVFTHPSSPALWGIYRVGAAGLVLESFSGEDFEGLDPAVSPDGSVQAFAFTTLRRAPGDVAVATVDGSGFRRLTNDEALTTNPAWSPDGNAIAFISDREARAEDYENGQHINVYVMAPDGSAVRRVTPVSLGVSAGHRPAWSPDGEFLAFIGHGPLEPGRELRHDLYTVQSDGSGLTVVAEGANLFAWSPDGSRLAFALDAREAAIYTSDPDGSNTRPVVSASIWDISWSPDGSEIFFLGYSPEHGDGPLYATTLNGTETRSIGGVLGRGRMAWSPDGSRLAVLVDLPFQQHTVDTFNPSKVALYTIAPDGSDLAVLVRMSLQGDAFVAESSGWREVSDDIAACPEGFLVRKPRENPGLVRDCELLLGMRNTLAGPDAFLAWTKDVPVAEWYGISVEGDPPRVTRMTLRSLQGTLPPELGELSGLRELYLWGPLQGGIPAELAKLGQLTTLRLEYTNLTGCIPRALEDIPQPQWDNHLGVCD